MTLSSESLAGPGYIVLNTIRAMNIIGFLAVITASVVMLVKISTASQFFFFDAVGHVITTIISVFLSISELCLFRSYFARNWPLLSPAHGFVTLALAMIALGMSVLGALNKPATSQESLGLSFWRVVIGAGILMLILGVFNLVASYVFRDRHRGITARQVRADGAVAVNKSSVAGSIASGSMSHTSSPTTKLETTIKTSGSFRMSPKDEESHGLPDYQATSPDHARPELSPSSKYSRATWCSKKRLFGGRNRESAMPPLPLPINISRPLNTNPQFVDWVKRPDSAQHPSKAAVGETHRWKAVK